MRFDRYSRFEYRPLFMGQGAISSARSYELVERLMKAFVDLSAIQQGISDAEEIQHNVDETAKDIFAALTGKIAKIED